MIVYKAMYSDGIKTQLKTFSTKLKKKKKMILYFGFIILTLKVSYYLFRSLMLMEIERIDSNKGYWPEEVGRG